MQAVMKIAIFIMVLAFLMVYAQGSFLSDILPKPPPKEAVEKPAPQAPSATPAAPVVAKKTSTYEEFLEGIKALANSVMPEKAKFDSQIAAVNAETPAPRDEYESSVEYEKRLVDFEKTKKQKIASLQLEYQKKTKNAMEKIKANMNTKDDFQPDFAGMLEKNTDINGYLERIDNLARKISEMKTSINQVSELLDNLNFQKNELKTLIKHWREKNMLYISRLGRAQELMKDYIVQEQAKILTTPRSKFEMSLGAYNPDKGEFEFSMNDAHSGTPFDYFGIIKIANNQAREMNRRTDDLTASIDYINYPFTATSGSKLYPGVMKAHVFYKGQEVSTNGSFKVVQNLKEMKGFMEWAIYADSLISSKLSPRYLTPSYVTSKDSKIKQPKNRRK
jgi:hypothetical protein